MPNQLISLTYKIKRPLERKVAILISAAMHLTSSYVTQNYAVNTI